MSLILVAVFGADKQHKDYAVLSPLDVGMNFIATFGLPPGERVDVGRVTLIHALECVPHASVDQPANQVTFQVDYTAMVLAGIFTWDHLIGEISRLYYQPPSPGAD